MIDNTFGELDAHLMREGKHPRLHDKLGPHHVPGGVRFAVWAPHAAAVSVVGDFNDWTPGATPMLELPETGGVWSVEVPGVAEGALYKLHITTQAGEALWKADPFALRQELDRTPPRSWWTPEHRVARRGVDGIARSPRRCADGDLRGPPRLVAAHRRPLAHVPGDRAAASNT